jgi:hypothetical protein
MYVSLFRYTSWHMPFPSHHIWFHHICWAEQTKRLPLMHFFPVSCYFFPLKPKAFLTNLFSNTLHQGKTQSFKPYNTWDKIILLYILMIQFHDRWRVPLFHKTLQFTAMFSKQVFPTLSNISLYCYFQFYLNIIFPSSPMSAIRFPY